MTLTRPNSGDQALLARTPAAARRVRYLGLNAAGFEAAHLARNPAAAFVGDGAEALVVDDLATLLDEPSILDALEPDGVLAALVGADAVARLPSLEDLGLEILQLQSVVESSFFDDRAQDLAPAWRAGALASDAAAGGLVVTARRARPDAPSPLQICYLAFAPTLMDIRTRLPTHGLRTEPELTVSFQRSPAPTPDLPPATPKIHVLQRPALRDLAAWKRGMLQNIRAGWVVVIEYDDHPELVAEVKGRVVGDADWLRFGCVHAVQTSTATLGEAFGRYNPETVVFPNSVFQLEPFVADRPRRIFYGGVSRGAFAADAARALAPALAEFPDAAVFVVGDKAVFEAMPTPNKRYFDFLPYDDYLRLMATCSISLSPIEGRPHQETKSDAKFLDAASRGVLTIASPTIYARTIRHGETGLIAGSLADWSPLLAGALRNEADRRRMARHAWDEVRSHRMFADQVRVRRDWYRDLWARREELNAALIARLERLPGV